VQNTKETEQTSKNKRDFSSGLGLGDYSYFLICDYDKFVLIFFEVYFLLGCVQGLYDVGGCSRFCLYDYYRKCAFLEDAVKLGEAVVQCNEWQVIFCGIFCYGIVFGAFKICLRDTDNVKAVVH
jgi:hypothetical protein